MNLGIPAITISGGGIGSGAHSLNEIVRFHGFLERHATGAAAGRRVSAVKA